MSTPVRRPAGRNGWAKIAGLSALADPHVHQLTVACFFLELRGRLLAWVLDGCKGNTTQLFSGTSLMLLLPADGFG